MITPMTNRRKKLTILMLTNTYAPIMGGLERSIQTFSSEFRRRGHRAIVVAPAHEGAPEREAHVIRLPAFQRFSGTDFSVNIPIPGLLAGVMDRFRPDVLHAHHPFLMGDIALRLASQYHVPLVFTYHTLFEQYSDFLLKGEAGKRFVSELATGYSNLCDHVIAPSESVRNLLREKGVVKPITVVPTGVNPAFGEKGAPSAIRRRLKIPRDAWVAGHIGRLSPEKNLEFLADGVTRFLKQEKKAHFLLVGKGPSLKSVLRSFAEAGVKDRVHYAGVLKGQDLVSAYQAMDTFAFASQSETQGMVVTEAMAAGVPVVAVDAPGVREAVRDRVNGRLLAKEDADAFAKALSGVSQLSAPRLKRMQAAARKTADGFSLELCADRALQVYRRIRHHRAAPFRDGEHPWLSVMGRIKMELDMMANIGNATKAAVTEPAPTKTLTPEPVLSEPTAVKPTAVKTAADEPAADAS